MSSTPHPDSSLDCPGALIAALPAVLGFVPVQSLVLVTAAGGEMGAVLRSDLVDCSDERLRELAELAAASGAQVVFAVIVDADGAGCPACVDDHRWVIRTVGSALAALDVELVAAHVVSEVAVGARWYCVDGCGNSGVVDDPTASPTALAAVLDGRRLYARREELLAVVATADEARTAALTERIDADAPDRPRSEAEACTEIKAVLDCVAQHGTTTPLTDAQLSRLAWAMTDTRVRDTLYALAVGDRAGAAEALWAHLSRTLPAPWRVEALVLLAFSAYARGDGPMAGISLDAALRCGPHRMAGMLDRALQAGMRPDQIRELADTGYRLAAQLGVRLPPRRLFGRRAG
ncbi:hypothetical protein FHR72_001662 [Mycolicibacterium iranicum]|uniref:DUF4192 domain-containing protein n=1 Tax=Mycolicibacterium iranicum TaxID=912594 RepID=A0A839Q5N8_MYCIR|nr:DUF4192 domain-containing protein [Mycolicibacterium iranicum]MBB2990194.1 hypothetical protein [Mycolicibacterium iranicum]